MSVTRKGLDRSLLQKYTSMTVKAGILQDATYPADEYRDNRTGEMVKDNRAGMKVATIARALHYGVGQNHPRPFISLAVAQHKKEWVSVLIKRASEGLQVRTAMLEVGQLMREDIQQAVRDWPADNSAEWEAVKGFNKGLTQTAHMVNSVASEVVE